MLLEVFAETMPHHQAPATGDALFGPEGVLDSMDLVNFLADVEEEVNERWDADIIVADTRALSRKRSPFRSITALAEYCIEQLGPA